MGSEERSGSAGPSQVPGFPKTQTFTSVTLKVLKVPPHLQGPGCPEQRPQQQQQQLDLPEDPQDSFFDDPLPKAQKTYGWWGPHHLRPRGAPMLTHAKANSTLASVPLSLLQEGGDVPEQDQSGPLPL